MRSSRKSIALWEARPCAAAVRRNADLTMIGWRVVAICTEPRKVRAGRGIHAAVAVKARAKITTLRAMVFGLEAGGDT